jgi:PII-like signaling protein
MDIVGTGKRVRIYIGEHDKATGHHDPLWETILNYLREEGAAGATMVRGLAGFGHYRGQTRATARELMRTPPVTVAADTPVAEAAQRMLEARRKVLPITDAEGRLLGVVDRADLLGHVHEPGAKGT